LANKRFRSHLDAKTMRNSDQAERTFASLTSNSRTRTTGVPASPTLPHLPKTAEVVAGTLRRSIVNGDLRPGDHLPNEAGLIDRFGISRSTVREALRLLESEHLVEVRRGVRRGALVTLPGPDVLARPAALLLQMAGATMADVTIARCGIEPVAVNLLATQRPPGALQELESIVAEAQSGPAGSHRVELAVAGFHRRIVELSGNVTLGMLAGMLFEVTMRHTGIPDDGSALTKSRIASLIEAQRELLALVRTGDGGSAEAFWRGHLESFPSWMPHRLAGLKVHDDVD
jgi:GntR family transcriptional repressor for pyruvate dehydrogenase complex